jgi:hypothetical protein
MLVFWKAQEAIIPPPASGTVLITVSGCDRPAVGVVASQFAKLGFKIRAIAGTHAFLASQGIASEPVLKEHEGRANITDATTLAAAMAAAKGIAAYREGKSEVRSLELPCRDRVGRVAYSGW